MPATPPKPPPPAPRRPSGEYAYAAREEQPHVPSERVIDPPRSLSPPGLRIDLKEDGFDARVRGAGGVFRRLAPWIVPAVMSVLGWLGGIVIGYYQGLKRAAAEVAAVKLEIDLAKARLELNDKNWSREAVVSDDHEKRLLRLERTLKLDPQAAAILSSPELVITKPVVP